MFLSQGKILIFPKGQMLKKFRIRWGFASPRTPKEFFSPGQHVDFRGRFFGGVRPGDTARGGRDSLGTCGDAESPADIEFL